MNGKKQPGVVVNELGHGQSSALYITEVNVNQCGIGSKMSSGGNSSIKSPSKNTLILLIMYSSITQDALAIGLVNCLVVNIISQSYPLVCADPSTTTVVPST